MAFPVDVRTELALGADLANADSWVWTDVTPWVRTPEGKPSHEITRGYQDETGDAPPAKCRLDFDNRDGRFSPRNPTGAWHGRLNRNTPLRVLVRRVVDTFTRGPLSGAWGTSDTGQPWSTFWAGGSQSANDWAVTGGTGVFRVPATAAHRSAWLSTVSLSDVEAGVTFTVTGVTDVTGTGNLEPGGIILRAQNISSYYLARVEITPAESVVASLHVVGGGGQFASAAVPGLTYTGQPLRMVARVCGQTVQLKVWNPAGAEPAGWAVTGTPPAAAQLRRGGVGLRCGVASGNTNTLPVEVGYDDLSVSVPRFTGYLDELPPRWDQTGRDRYVTVTASGITRRLVQSQPLRSALYRRVTSRDWPQPVAYWPCEDPEGASRVAAGAPGVEPMAIYGAGVELASYSDIEGSAPLPKLGTAKLIGRIPRYTHTGTLVLRFALHVPAAYPSDRDMVELRFSRGTIRRWVIRSGTTGDLMQRAFDVNGVELLAQPFIAFGYIGKRCWCELNLVQDGANIDWEVRLYAYPPGASNYDAAQSGIISGTEPGTLGPADRITIAPASNLTDTTIGHIIISNNANTAPALLGGGAYVGWRGETASNRVSGMCHDALVPVIVDAHDTTLSCTVGPQPAAGALMELLRESTAVDGGLLYDAASVAGLRMVPIGARYNRPVDLALDVAAGDLYEPPEPTDDDQQLRNQVRASRPSGSSAVASDPASIAIEGEYAHDISRNVNTDAELPYQAQWAVNLGTVDEARVPSLSLNLRARPTLIDAWLSCDAGARLTATGPPPGLPPDPIDQHMIGYTERLGPYDWTADLVCVPASPYDAFQIESTGNLGRLDTADCELDTAADADDTPIRVTTTAGPIWTTDGAEPPFDLAMAGERLTVSAVGAVLNANPYLPVDASDWSGTNATAVRSTAVVHTVKGAVASLLITPNGAAASGGANSGRTAAGTITPGQTYRAQLWAYSPAGWSDLRAAVDWYDAADVFLSSSLGVGTAVPGGQWRHLQQIFVAPAGASRVSVRARHGGTPTVDDIWYAWGIKLVDAQGAAVFVGSAAPVSSANAAGNATLNPALPAGLRAGDLLLVLASIRNDPGGAVTIPAGYTALMGNNNVRLLAKIAAAGEAAPAITYSGGVANATIIAQTAAFRGASLRVAAATGMQGSSGQNIAVPALAVPADNCLLIWVAWKADDWTGLTSPAQATGHIGSHTSTLGDDASQVWDYRVQGSGWDTASAQYTVTGGASAASKAGVIALYNAQTLTVTRSVNGVTKPHEVGEGLSLWRPPHLAL